MQSGVGDKVVVRETIKKHSVYIIFMCVSNIVLSTIVLPSSFIGYRYVEAKGCKGNKWQDT